MKAIIITAILIIAATAQARQSKFGDVPAKYNYGAVIRLTEECISTRVGEVKTDIAMKYLIEGCFNDVKHGKWDKRSRRKYIDEQKRRARYGY